LAEKLGKSAALVSQIASGRCGVSYDTLVALVRAGMSAEEMFGEELGREFKRRCCEECNGGGSGADEERAMKVVLSGIQGILKLARG
jgi:transcriptional regulator with XRE-family HTH domain